MNFIMIKFTGAAVYHNCCRQLIAPQDTKPRRVGKIEILPVQNFLKELWATGFR